MGKDNALVEARTQIAGLLLYFHHVSSVDGAPVITQEVLFSIRGSLLVQIVSCS